MGGGYVGNNLVPVKKKKKKQNLETSGKFDILKAPTLELKAQRV